MKKENNTIKIILYIIFSIIFIFGIRALLNRKEGFNNPSKNAIVIVEPREHKDLQRVLEDFDKKIPEDWDCYIFCGKSTVKYSENASKNLKRKTIIIPLDTDNLTGDEYNKLFKQKSFWDKVDAENILVFQTDTALCGKSTFNINNFTNYDYIGCSVNDTAIGKENSPWLGAIFYGVGGLSFRKKSFMEKCIEKRKDINPIYPEDVFFSECVHESENRPRDPKVIAEFCSQSSFKKNSFGAHKTKLMSKDDQDKFYQFCPEAEFLKEQFINFN